MGEAIANQPPLSNEEMISVEKLFASIDLQVIDKLFQMSVQLDSDSIVDFIEALCDLSRAEIST